MTSHYKVGKEEPDFFYLINATVSYLFDIDGLVQVWRLQ